MRKIIFTLVLCTFICNVFSQRINQVPDSLRKKNVEQQRGKVSKIDPSMNDKPVTADDEIKARLIKLALNNPQATINDANIKIAELNKRKASLSWLSSISVGGNVNEFVINNSPAANFFPKYNIGVLVPFDVFSRTSGEKKVADQTIKIATAEKEQRENAMKAEVLTRYEVYKEQRDLQALQYITVENNYSDYQAAQKNFADGSIDIESLNKYYKLYIVEKVKIISITKEFNVAKIELEELIGMPLNNALQGLYAE